MDKSALVGFTFGALGTVRDTQTAYVGEDAYRTGAPLPAPRETDADVHRVGDYAIDYSPLSPGDLIDPDVDAEIEALLATSTVVHCNEGV